MSSREVRVVILGDSRQAQRAFADLNRAAAQSQSGLVAMGQKAITAGQSMSRVGASMSRSITLPLAGLAIAAVKTAVDFEKTMNTMGAVAKVPAPQLEKLRALAIDMGAKTVFSANEAAQGMLELAKAGIKTADIMGGALKNTLDLATAGDLELADAARIAANAMHTFNLSGKDSKQIADALAGAANASSADVADLALALSQGGLAASRAGLSIQETTGALAAFADAGMRGSDAGTSLKTFLLNLVPTSARAKEEMNRLGVSFTDARGEILPLTQIAQVLQDRLGGLSQAEQQTALKVMFGTDAYRAAAIVMEQGAGGLQKYIEATSQSGTAAEVAAGKMKGLPGAIERMKGSIETFLLAVGSALAPTIAKVAGFIQTLADGFTKLPKPVQQAAVAFGALLAATGPVLFIAGKITSAWGHLVVGGAKVVTTLSAISTAMKTQAALAALEGVAMAGTAGKVQAASAALEAHSGVYAGLMNQIRATQATGASFAASAGAWGGVFIAAAAAVTTWTMAYRAWRDAQAEAQVAGKATLSMNEQIVRNYAAGTHTFEQAAQRIKMVLRDETLGVQERADAYRAGLHALNQTRVAMDGARLANEKNAESVRKHIEVLDKAGVSTQGLADHVKVFAGMSLSQYDKWRADTVKNFNLVEGALGKLAEKHSVTGDEILDAFDDALKAQLEFEKNWSKVVEKAGKGSDELLKYIQENFGAQAPALIAAMAKMNDREFAQMIKTWNKAADSAERASGIVGGSLIKGIGGGAQKATSIVGASVARIPGVIASVIGGARAAGTSVGAAIGSGLAVGIRATLQVALNTISSAISALAARARAAAQIKSPSRVFARIGEDIMRGLAKGISDKARSVSNEAAAVVRQIEKQVGRVENLLDKATDKGQKLLAKALRNELQELGKLQRDAEKAHDRLANLRDRMDEFRSDIASGFDALSDINSVRDLLEEGKSAAADRVNDAQSKLQDALGELTTATNELATLRGEEDADTTDAEARLARAKEALAVAEAEVARAQAEAAEAAGPGAVRKLLQHQKDVAKRLADGLRQLAEKNIGKEMLRQLASQGADALPFIETLLTGGDELINFAQNVTGDIQRINEELATYLEQQFFGEELAELNKEVDALAKAIDRAVNYIDRLADSVANAPNLNDDRWDDPNDPNDNEQPAAPNPVQPPQQGGGGGGGNNGNNGNNGGGSQGGGGSNNPGHAGPGEGRQGKPQGGSGSGAMSAQQAQAAAAAQIVNNYNVEVHGEYGEKITEAGLVKKLRRTERLHKVA